MSYFVECDKLLFIGSVLHIFVSSSGCVSLVLFCSRSEFLSVIDNVLFFRSKFIILGEISLVPKEFLHFLDQENI